MIDKNKARESLINIIAAIEIINESGEYSGTITCPKCAGELMFSKAKSNGHTHGKCKTEGCLAWMQ